MHSPALPLLAACVAGAGTIVASVAAAAAGGTVGAEMATGTVGATVAWSFCVGEAVAGVVRGAETEPGAVSRPSVSVSLSDPTEDAFGLSSIEVA